MLAVHKIYVCNCLVLFLLFLSFLSHFLNRMFFHFFHCVKTHFSSLVKHISPVTYVWVSGINKHWEQRQDLDYHTPTAVCAVNTDSGSRQEIPQIQAVQETGCPNSQCVSSISGTLGHSGQLVWLKWPAWRPSATELPGQSDSSCRAASAAPSSSIHLIPSGLIFLHRILSSVSVQ